MRIKLSEHSERAKAKYIIPFTYSLVVMGVFFGVYYYLKYSAVNLAVSCLVASLAACFIPLIKRITNSHLFMANYVTSIHFINVTFLTLHTGGIKASAIWWFGTVPILASFLMNATFSIIWYVIVLINIICISSLSKTGALPYNILTGAPLEKLLMVSLFLCTSLITALCVLSDSLREKTSREKEELQKRSFQLTQLASLGQLSAGVAHEINNPLAVIMGAQLKIERMIKSQEPLDKKELEHYMEMVQRNVTRIHEITSSMRTFSDKNQDKTLSSINIGQMLLANVEIFKERLTKNSIEVTTSLGEEDVHFHGIYTEIFQAFYNVIDNSIDILKKKADARQIQILLSQDENFITVVISDNGEGIPENVRSRIFDPFFTTKSVGEGKGLGLTYAYNIFTHNGGSIEAVPSEVSGTDFIVRLPVKSG